MHTLPSWLSPCIFVAPHRARAVLPADCVFATAADALRYQPLDTDRLANAAMCAGGTGRLTLSGINVLMTAEFPRVWCYAIANDPDKSDALVFLGCDKPSSGPLATLVPSTQRSIDDAIQAAEWEEDAWLRLVAIRDADSAPEKARLFSRFVVDFPPRTGLNEPASVTQARDLLVRISAYNYLSRWSFAHEDFPKRPQYFRLSHIRKSLPHGVLIPYCSDSGTIAQVVEDFLATTHKRLSRDNTYAVLGAVSTVNGDVDQLLIAWEPHGDKPPYLHVRKAVESEVAASLATPRLDGSHPPRRAYPDSVPLISSGLFPPDIRHFDGSETEMRIPTPDRLFKDRDELADRTTQSIKEMGFEAFGWYSPWHYYSESTWGIYLHAERLEEMSFTVWQEASRFVSVPFELAAMLVVRTVYDHEMFHAKVEAAASFLEIGAVTPKYQPYHANVYNPLWGTSDCREEALANYSASRLWNSYRPHLYKGFPRSAVNAVLAALTESMDLSAPGYRDWQAGNASSTWRTLATELIAGVPHAIAQSSAIPAESLLNEAIPVDISPCDVPVYVYGSSATLSAMMAMPSCFGVPSRRELCKALKHLGYEPTPHRGKGSHELWTKSEKQAIPIPRTDPVSRTVFGTFLSQCGISKADYVTTIRPLL
jgi:predicted RNA binding protein YcfA (HicA-like mRNA interferase family)